MFVVTPVIIISKGRHLSHYDNRILLISIKQGILLNVALLSKSILTLFNL